MARNASKSTQNFTKHIRITFYMHFFSLIVLQRKSQVILNTVCYFFFVTPHATFYVTVHVTLHVTLHVVQHIVLHVVLHLMLNLTSHVMCKSTLAFYKWQIVNNNFPHVVLPLYDFEEIRCLQINK